MIAKGLGMPQAGGRECFRRVIVDFIGHMSFVRYQVVIGTWAMASVLGL